MRGLRPRGRMRMRVRAMTSHAAGRALWEHVTERGRDRLLRLSDYSNSDQPQRDETGTCRARTAGSIAPWSLATRSRDCVTCVQTHDHSTVIQNRRSRRVLVGLRGPRPCRIRPLSTRSASPTFNRMATAAWPSRFATSRLNVVKAFIDSSSDCKGSSHGAKNTRSPSHVRRRIGTRELGSCARILTST